MLSRLVVSFLACVAIAAGSLMLSPIAGAQGKGCGTFSYDHPDADVSYTYSVKRFGGETCGHALRIVKSFIRDYDSWQQHGDGTLASTHWTNSQYKGWRCAQGGAAGTCRRGKKVAGYTVVVR